MAPSLTINKIPFFDAPPEIEGSPYWVDLWTEVNGYMIGLQIKPHSYNSASTSIYCGKAKSSQKNGNKKFSEKFGGRVFILTPTKGQVDYQIEIEIMDEVNRLMQLPKGGFSY